MNKRIFRRIFTLSLVFALILCTLVKGRQTAAVQTEEDILTGKTSTEIVAMMDKGYNIGNALDATGGSRGNLLSQETSWGNPAINRELVEGIKKAGFDTVRIPTTWYKHLSKEDGYRIDTEWMEHVKEIVDYAYENGFFVILNMHHEEWLNTSDLGDNYQEIGEELSAIWKQIAENFADYDQHLIFEGMNEPRAAGTSYEWTGTQKEYEAVNYLNQLFVDAVRDNGKGFNGERALMVPAYAASSSEGVLKALELPKRNGETDPNLIVSVHCYNPYNFCLSDEQVTFNPKSISDTSGITGTFRSIKKLFTDNGIPAIIGECGCTNTRNNNESRLLWFDFFGAQSREYGVPAIVWDNGHNGTSGGESHYYINRKTGEAVARDLIDAFILGYTPGPKVLDSQTITFEPQKVDDGTLVLTPSEAGFSPRELSMQMRINHTPDVAVGFALKISKDLKEQTAVYDMSGYIGKDVIVTGYLLSDDGTGVSYGIKSGSALNENGKISANAEWKKFAFRCTVKEGDGVFLSGEAGKTFYMDDLSIIIVDDKTDVNALLDMSENEVNDGDGADNGTGTNGENGTETNNGSGTNGENETDNGTETNNGNGTNGGNETNNESGTGNDASQENDSLENEDSFVGWPWLAGGLATVLAVFGVFFGIKNRKKK